ncbi:MAG: hypothetical protein MJZ29_04070 [Bacteroidaceae bacterium]|nr:hypothetical protein [Bacteroidaceae bacterium]
MQHFNNKILSLLVAFTAAILLPSVAFAQEGAFRDVDFQVVLKNKSTGKAEYEPVQYCVVKSARKAHDVRIALEKAVSEQEEDLAAEPSKYIDKALKKQNVVFQISANNGTFRAHVEDGMAVVILAQSTYVRVEEITPNKNSYKLEIEMRALQEVTVVDRRRRGPEFKKVPGIDTGFEVRFTCPVFLPKGYTREDTRLAIQPMVIDCQTEDTIAYADPIVFEGGKYHKMQNKRMGFNYMKNDPVAPYYDSSIQLNSNEPFEYVYTTTFRKPDKDKTYKGAYRTIVEDYSHVVFDNGGLGTGSCLAFRPFKFLNFDVAKATMPLNDEFRVDAASNYMAVDRKLTLTFEMGKDVLTSDSINDKEFGRLIAELKSYGDKLYKVQVEGAASAEGNEVSNKNLAAKRAARAVAIIQNGLGRNADVRIPAPLVKVHSWTDVADELLKQGYRVESNKVHEVVAASGNGNPSAAMKGLEFYNTLIEPILAKQRIMRCTYQYEMDHVMTPQEAAEEYYRNKDKYLSDEKDFSDGDYYNLFQVITNEKDVDDLTDIAYRHILKTPGYEMNKFSPYVANKKALKCIRKGTPDPSILRPFIDYNIKNVNQRKQINQFSSIVINREEILANQAIMYFQEMQLDTAQYIIDWLPKNLGTERIVKFVDFIRLYFKDRTQEEDARYNEAFDYVLDSSPENRAIIFTELRQQLGKTVNQAEFYVNLLDDNNPKKWYLKGLLYAEQAGKEPKVLDNTPYFLAYFQHSFDLEPRYERLFHNEGSIDDDLRKKFPYKKKDKDKYRAKFAAIKAIDPFNALQNADAAKELNDEPNLTDDQQK